MEIPEAYAKIRWFRSTLQILKSKTEWKSDEHIYWELMERIIGEETTRHLRLTKAPVMRIALYSKSIRFLDIASWKCTACVKGRIPFMISYNAVTVYVTFNTKEFVEYILLHGTQTININVRDAITDYLLGLRDELINECGIRPSYVRQKYFSPFLCGTYEEILPKVAEVLSLYLSLKAKSKIRIKKPNKIVELFITQKHGREK